MKKTRGQKSHATVPLKASSPHIYVDHIIAKLNKFHYENGTVHEYCAYNYIFLTLFKGTLV